MIKMIAACTSNGVIGVDGKIPFDYSADMKQFKALTTGHIVVMGRKTFEGIGRPLPNRENVVISKIGKALGTLDKPGIRTYNSVEGFIYHESTLLRDHEKDIWFIGGHAIYQEGMKFAKEIHLTITPDEENDKDAIKFPWINPTMFTLYDMTSFKDEPKLKYCIYKRK